MTTVDQILRLYAVRMNRNDSEFPDGVMHLRGGYCINNGTLAIVDTNADVWLIRLSVFSDRPIDSESIPLNILPEWVNRYRGGQFIVDFLDGHGYEFLNFWVPHSNDCGRWMKENSPVNQTQLIADMVREKLASETEARIRKIQPTQLVLY